MLRAPSAVSTSRAHDRPRDRRRSHDCAQTGGQGTGIGMLVWALIGSVLAMMGATSVASGDRAPGDDGDDQEPSSARLVVEHEALIAGRTMPLGVTFDIAPHWHVYWDGLNDSGFPALIELDLPEGWEAEPTIWPAPQRFLMPEGPILDHGYERELTLIIPVRVPEGADGSTSRIRASVEWLVCKDVCVPAFAELSLDVPVVSGGDEEVARSADGERFDRTRARLPKPWSEPGLKRSLGWDGRTLVLEVPGAAEVLFYPRTQCLALENKYEDTRAEGERLDLRFRAPEGERTRVRGIVEAKSREGRTIGLWEVDAAPPKHAGDSTGNRIVGSRDARAR